MKNISNKGFVLAELLVVCVFLMIIFSMGKELKTSYVKYNFNRNLTLKRRLRKIDADAKFKE